VLTTRDFL